MKNKTNKFSVTSILVISTLILNPYIMAQSKVTLKKQTENTERNIYYRTINAAGHNIFYRESGPQDAPVILLLHGYPTSSHMFRSLIPILNKKYHVIAPDLPGFGYSDSPKRENFEIGRASCRERGKILVLDRS